MQTPVSLKSAERKAFQTSFADGLWDVFIGCFVLIFAVAPLLSEALGDFWSSVVFLPFWGLVYLSIRQVREHVLAVRVGTVSFSKARNEKLHKFSIVMAVTNSLVLILGILVVLFWRNIPGGWLASLSGMLGFILLAGFSLAAYLLDYLRLYIYGLLLFVAPLVGEWLYQNYGVSHHGFPIVFGAAAGVMILTGLVLFAGLLKNNPVIEIPEKGE